MTSLADELRECASYMAEYGGDGGDAIGLLRRAASALEAERWVACSERLPSALETGGPEQTVVVLAAVDGRVRALTAWPDGKFTGEDGYRLVAPSHWRPLPPAPASEPA